MNHMKLRKPLVIVGSIALIAMGVACGSGGSHVKADNKPAVATAKATATDTGNYTDSNTDSTDSSTDSNGGLTSFVMGQSGTVTQDDEEVAQVTLSNARVLKDFDGRNALVVTVTIKALPTASDSYDFNEFDFDARAADGTALDITFLDGGPAELHSGTLAPGQTAKGVLIYKLGKESQHGVVIDFTPGLDTLAYWTTA